MDRKTVLKEAPLGRPVNYVSEYSPGLLFPIRRRLSREMVGLRAPLPFFGQDIWTGFEVSWLGPKGKPELAIGTFVFPCESPCLIESKSFKLYVESFNQTTFSSKEEVMGRMVGDLSKATGATVEVFLRQPNDWSNDQFSKPAGVCLDALDVEISEYKINPSLLQLVSGEIVQEKVYTNLFKCNCLKTGQPDWATVMIHYRGPRIDHGSLLRYLVSHRQDQGFSEDSMERIWVDLQEQCQVRHLSIFGAYTRRGGLDINPFRSNWEQYPDNFRLPRQ